MAKKYYWLRLKDDWFNSKVVKKLRKIAGGDTYTIIYLKMQLLSLKNEGKLFYEGVEDSFEEELALDLDEEIDNVTVTVSFLKKCGLLEITDTDEYILTEVPAAIGSESESAERVRKHRAQKALNKQMNDEKALQCNAPVTDCNTEIDIEKEIDIELEIDACCAEPFVSTPEPEPIIKLPLNTGEEYLVFQCDLDEFAELYPAVDVPQAMRDMRGWLITNPERRKTKKGIRRFMNSWLAKEQDRAGRPAAYDCKGKHSSNSFNSFPQNRYDIQTIEQRILANDSGSHNSS